MNHSGNGEQIVALWTEGRKYEYKVTVSVGYSTVQFREYSRRIGTKEWLPENKIITVPKDRLLEMLSNPDLRFT